MRRCKNLIKEYEAERKWHPYYVWFPKKIKVGELSCWIWLEWVESK